MQWCGVRVLLYNLAVFYHLCLALWHWYFIKGGRDSNCLYSPRILLPPKYFNRSFNFNYCLFKQVGFNSIAKFLIQVDNRYDWKWTIMVNIQIKLNLIGFKSQIPQTYPHILPSGHSIYQKIFPLMQGTAHCVLLPSVVGHGQKNTLSCSLHLVKVPRYCGLLTAMVYIIIQIWFALW